MSFLLTLSYALGWKRDPQEYEGERQTICRLIRNLPIVRMDHAYKNSQD